jgi:hypothetical protein
MTKAGGAGREYNKERETLITFLYLPWDFSSGFSIAIHVQN